MELTNQLHEALKYAARNEGTLHTVDFERMKEYRELEISGLIILDQKALGMGITHITDLGKSYL
ncbi:hypothetical protein D1872_242410 [compost metagenome]